MACSCLVHQRHGQVRGDAADLSGIGRDTYILWVSWAQDALQGVLHLPKLAEFGIDVTAGQS